MRKLTVAALSIVSTLSIACQPKGQNGGDTQAGTPYRNRPGLTSPQNVDPRANWTFEQWCRATARTNPESRNLTAGTADTVFVLLSIAGEFDCAKADRKLNAMESITVAGNGLTSAEPFMAFKKAKQLYLDENKFKKEQIAKLQVLTSLEILSVTENAYSGITCPLTRPDALCSLDSGDVFVTASR